MGSQGIELPVEMPAAAEPAAAPAPSRATMIAPPKNSAPWAAMLAVPIAAGVALAVHHWVPNGELLLPTGRYPTLLIAVLALAVAAAGLQVAWPALRRWMREKSPLFAAALILLTVWDLITLKFALLPLPYFPGPEGVLQALVEDRELLFESTWHSLLLLLGGYAVGVVAGLISGITIGWSRRAQYWGMPVLKIVGPIPATAWIPLAMVIFPSLYSAVFLIALAVWFPVTMLSASGISNVRASYLDVARTLGAGRGYLIFRVAIPAAMPSIFIGLFMGLGASFLTLLAAESIGVKSGLGWYIDWARTYAEYTRVYAALVIMAVFFSTVMTLLFKIRDRALVWQKGVIKW